MEKHVEYFKVTSEEVNHLGFIRIPILQKKIQDVSDNHGAILGFGFADMFQIGLFWVVSRLMVEIKRLPKINETFTIETWLETPGKVGINRYYRLAVEKEEIVTGIAKWALVSRDSITVAKLDQYDFITNLTFLDEQVHFSYPVLKKIQKMDSIVPHRSVKQTVSHEMLDHNGHVNNTEYIKIALNASRYQRGLKMYQISYSKALYDGDLVELDVYEFDSETIVEGLIIDESNLRNLAFQVKLLS